MKRRLFLSAAGAVGIMGAVSGSTLVSTSYSSLNTNVLLSDFSETSTTILDKFVADLTSNIQSLEIEKALVNRIAMPVHIVKNNKQGVVYKNKCGDYVSLHQIKGEATIRIGKDM